MLHIITLSFPRFKFADSPSILRRYSLDSPIQLRRISIECPPIRWTFGEDAVSIPWRLYGVSTEEEGSIDGELTDKRRTDNIGKTKTENMIVKLSII